MKTALKIKCSKSGGSVASHAADEDSNPQCQAAFSVHELLVVILVLAMCSLVVISSRARSRPSGQTFQCLNNLRQLTLAWQNYATDFHGSLVAAQNGMAGRVNWMQGVLNFTSDPPNWDTSLNVVNSPLWPYAERNAAIFRCPADPSTVIVAGVRRPRVRTYSLSQVFGTGEWLDKSPNAAQNVWRTYGKAGDIVSPNATFVFAEEHPASINDGSLASACTGAQPTNAPTEAQIIDYPASHHSGVGLFSFADGRVEMHQWLGSKIKARNSTAMQLNVPAADSWMDVQWLARNTTVRR